MLENFNLFPESRYLRVQKNAELNHKCGGIASIFIIIVLIIILIFELIRVFEMKTFSFVAEKIMDIEPKMSTISTFQNDPNNSPYLITTSFRNAGCNSSKTVRAYHYTVQNLTSITPAVNISEIILEQCTAEHFSIVPSLRDKIQQIGIGQVMCLPINKTYQIGGSFQLSDTWKAILFQYNCTQSCGVNNCGTIIVNHLNSFINPNNLNPFEYFLDRNDMDLSDRTWNQYVADIDDHQVFTDESITPFPRIFSQKSFSNKAFKKRRQVIFTSQTTTDLWVQKSSASQKVHRTKLQLINVLSYVGGFFPSLFAIFFFIKIFGLQFFEMAFAHEQFKSKQTKSYGFSHFVKNVCYQALTSLGFELKNWKIAKKQAELHEFINKLLDINYLFRRIEFLERGMEILLSKHQLKGVYLSRWTVSEAQNRYKRTQIRDHLVKYIHKRQQESLKLQDQHQKKRQLEIIRPTDLKNSKKKGEKTTESNREMAQKSTKGPTEQDKAGVEKLTKEDIRRREHQDRIAQESSMIKDIEEVDQEWVSEQLEGDLKLLFKEAYGKKCNPTSKTIVDNIDECLKKQLGLALKEYQKQNPRFQYRLYSQSDES